MRFRKIVVFFDFVVDFLAFLAGVLLIIATLLVCGEVFMRYFLKQPITWVDEITEYILAYITFLGTTWVLKNDGHIIFDLLLTRVGKKSSAILGVVNSIVCLPVCFVLLWFGAQVAWDHYRRGVFNPTLLEFPKGLVIAVIPLAGLLLLIQFLRRSYGYLNIWRMLK